MWTVRKILSVIGKTVVCIPVIAILVVAATSFSPVYHFREPRPFYGPDIFNPYINMDTVHCWKRANFHTHTRVKGLLNECELWPGDVYKAFEKFGYDIVTFSNHNEITVHPFDPALQVNAYEHGYNLLKYHKLVFGSDKVLHFDHLIPAFAFQKQFHIDLLAANADIVQINHPLRTTGFTDRQMEKLSGYRLIELDSGKSTENEYWDHALSAGHYSFGVANDDLHYPDKSGRIAVRCNFLCTPSAGYDDIRQCLIDGCFYSMRVPDYGRGDWSVKYQKNRDLPYISNIGLKDTTIYISISEVADSIKVIGQGHYTLLNVRNSDHVEYAFKPDDSYARITVYLPDGEVIYTNPFARYDSSISESPFDAKQQDVRILLTILFNMALGLILIGSIYALNLIIKFKR